MFKNSVDISMFKEDPSKEDPAIEAKRLEIEELEKKKSEEMAAIQLEEDIQTAREEAIDETEAEFSIPDASEIRNRTLEAIKNNAAIAVKKESTEILKTALKAIEFAIANEKFICELGGPGRPEPGPVVLRQAWGAYHEDARKAVKNRLETQGFKIQEFENVYIKISW